MNKTHKPLTRPSFFKKGERERRNQITKIVKEGTDVTVDLIDINEIIGK